MTRSTILFWAALLLAPILLLYSYYQSLWQIEQYRYFPVLFLAIGLLFWERWDRQLRSPTGWLSFAGLAFGVSVIILGIFLWSPWIANVGWLLICFVFFRSQWTTESESLVSIWPPMLLLVRLPLNLDQQLTSKLQGMTSRISSHLLDRMEVTHTLNGNIFDMPGGRLFVEDACSGVQSLFTLLFIAFFLVSWMKRSVILLPLYALSGIFWAAAMNVVRVVAIALAQEWYAMDLAHGWKHEVLGYACLGLAGLMLFSTDRLLRVVFYPLPSDLIATAKFNPLTAVWNWFFDTLPGRTLVNRFNTSGIPYLPTIAMSVALVLISAQFLFRPASVAASPEVSKDLLWEPGSDLFGTAVSGCPILDFESVRGGNNIELGFNSDIWKLNVEGIRARVAVSQPYNEFHDLCVCYESNGWQENDRTVVVPTGSDWAYVTARFVAPDGSYGSLVFSGLGVNGEPINPTDTSLTSMFSTRVRQTSSVYSNLMIQIWATSGTPLSPDQIGAIVKSHLEAREIVRSRLVRQ